MADLAGDVTRRPPSADDGELAGYQPGHLWVIPGDGRMWINRRNTPGRAVWQLTHLGYGYPAQAIASAPPKVAYGTRKLNQHYPGPLLRVAHPISGRGADIGALPSGGIDRNALWSMLEGATHLQVAVAYDQMGGGAHAIQETPENRPIVTPLAQLGNSVPLVFDGVIEGQRIIKKLDLPERLAVESQGHSQVAVSGFRAFSNTTGISTLFGGNANLCWGCSASNDRFMLGWGNHYILPRARAPVTPFVSGYSSAGPGEKTFIWLDGETMAGGATPNVPLVGGSIGQWYRNGGQGIELSALLIYDRAISQGTDMPAINASLNQSFALTPQLRDRVWCEGDSLTAGYGAAFDRNYPRQMSALLKRPARIYNTGAFGQTAGRRAAYVTAKAGFFFQPGARNVLVLWAGTNDLNGNAPSAQEIYRSLCQAISTAKETGFKTVLVTIPPRKSFLTGGNVPGQQENERRLLNELILENAVGADGIADVASDPGIGSFEATTNRELYVDTIHFTRLGYSFVASNIAEQVNRLL